MDVEGVIKKWFEVWEAGDYASIPVTEDFKHLSPYGTIEGKANYLALVEANKDQFLGHRFEFHDALYADQKACVRYSAIQGTLRYQVSEWYYFKDGLIEKIVANFHAGEISEERQLSEPE